MTILILIISLIAVAGAFIRRVPAALIAFAALLLAVLGGTGWFGSQVLWFWGIAAAIVTANQYLSPLPPLPALRYYTIGGALVGTVLGAVANQMAAVMVGGMVGAALGFLAFRRTPDGQINAPALKQLMLMADTALPALVAFFIVVIVVNHIMVVSML